MKLCSKMIFLFLIIISLLNFNLPINYLKDIQIIQNDVKELGDVGRLYIPSINISVRLYAVKSHNDGERAQKYTDWSDSAAYCSSFDGGCGYIADHYNQGFISIINCQINCLAYIKTRENIFVYRCVKITEGYNMEKYLCTKEGESLKNINWADICCYTCNGNWKNIYMVFFKHLLTIPIKGE